MKLFNKDINVYRPQIIQYESRILVAFNSLFNHKKSTSWKAHNNKEKRDTCSSQGTMGDRKAKTKHSEGELKGKPILLLKDTHLSHAAE